MNLYLHQHAGDLWWTLPGGQPERTELPLQKFLQKDEFSEVGSIRVLGMAQNADLLVKLYQMHLTGGRAVYVGSPAVCNYQVERDCPRVVLMLSQTLQNIPPGLGGWHAFNHLDLPVYSLAISRYRSQDERHSLLVRHPAYQDITFIPVHWSALADMVAHILDPRWFLTRRDTVQTARLENYMGLNQKMVKAVLNERVPATSRGALMYNRCRSVVQAWYPLRTAEEPRCFLHRITKNKPPSLGVLRASQYFLRYVFLVWLNALHACPVEIDRLFSPRYFFKYPREVEAFTSWRKTYRQAVDNKNADC